MKLLVIGNGGREHALAWKLAQSPKVETVFVAPGNAGTAIEPKLQNIALTAHQDLIEFCRKENIAFTVVGPEAPLAAGIVDDFRAAELKIFGPTQYAAQLESSKDFAKVVQEAIRLNKVTAGALDVTVGPLVNLWGFGPDKRLNKVPSEAQIAERASLVGIDKFNLDMTGEKPTLTKSVKGLYLDLSSIAKGFGVDKLAEYLEQLGISNYLVEIGGELRGKGNNLQNEPWRIAIEQPTLIQGESVQIIAPLHNLGMATSGNYRNYFEDENGSRMSHIIDPAKLSPVSHNLASITVLAPTTMTADGLSTGLFVLGAEKALAIAEKEKLAVFLIVKKGDNFETQMSSEFQKLIESK